MAQTKVLVVEDDQTLRSVLEYNLAKEGYRVLTASDGVEALEVARTERPHLVLLDIMLPKLDGLEVCRILRKETTVRILISPLDPKRPTGSLVWRLGPMTMPPSPSA